MEITRHFTATVLIVHKNKVLLHKHKQRGILLPVGGHLDRDELPQDAAMREVKEETGDITLYTTNQVAFKDARVLIQPIHMLLIDMNPYHQHIDFIFYARTAADTLEPSEGESRELYWLDETQIKTLEMPEDVRSLALDALRTLA